MNLYYSVDALEDLDRLREFIKRRNPTAAHQISIKLIDNISTLLDNPKIGRPVAKAPDPEIIRDLVFGNYIIRYILHTNSIVVLRVWHHREDRDVEFDEVE